MYFELAPTYSPGTSDPVPSALVGLTTLFGMEKGGSLPPKAPTNLYSTTNRLNLFFIDKAGKDQILEEFSRIWSVGLYEYSPVNCQKFKKKEAYGQLVRLG